MQCLQDPNQSNVDSLNNARREASRYFTNKEKNHLKAKTDELEKALRPRMSQISAGHQ